MRETDTTYRIRQGDLFSATDVGPAENPLYLTRQLITYIGNKRALLKYIGQATEYVKKRLGKTKLTTFDVFSGSGVVSRFFKAHSSHVISNDLEGYAATIARCYLSNKSDIDLLALDQAVLDLNQDVLNSMEQGFIEKLYAPKDENNITKNDRVFYTKENAQRLDNYRRLIDARPYSDIRDLLVAPLLSLASVHVNTSGVFKGFYKNSHTGIGKYGGNGSNALSRIRGDIILEPPVFSNFECEHTVLQKDANAIAHEFQNIDLAYIDPPYNQHPYGSNYFMLNLLDAYAAPEKISRVSGIPVNWRRSGYNIRSRSLPLLGKLLRALQARFLLVSYNDEGFIAPDDMRTLLASIGKVVEIDAKYNAFRGARNLRNREIHTTEYLFLTERF